MKKLFLSSTAVLMSLAEALAGGLNTNTNQSAEYLRNPARDGAIGIDGVYSNPAGVAFLDSGLHVSFNIQSAQQERNITSTFGAPVSKTNPFGGFSMGADNHRNTTKTFEGEASAPIVPSLQAAYNWKGWSFQLNTAVTGGGGKCEFDKGLGSFESNVAFLNSFGAMRGLLAPGYDADIYMKGRQYYIGITLGAAKKLNDNLSVYLGGRALYGNCSYKGYVKNMQFATPESDGALVPASKIAEAMKPNLERATAAYKQLAAAGQGDSKEAQELMGNIKALTAFSTMTEDIVLDCDQYGWGFAPIVGVDYKNGKWNLSARYEFRTKMELENDAVNSESAANFAVLNKFKDGAKVREDLPALLTAGVQYEILDNLRVMGGYHLYFDKSATQYGDRQDLLDKNTMEYLLGAEWDICKYLQYSVGAHRTIFGNTDQYISDMSYNVNNWCLGTGFGINFSERLKLNLSYYQSFYDDYKRETNNYNNIGNLVTQVAGADASKMLVDSGALKGSDKFERKNFAFGIGVNYRF